MRISDWSSDVCSSDLKATGTELYSYHASYIAAPIHPITVGIREERSMITGLSRPAPGNGAELIQTRQIRPPNRSDCPVACSGKTGNQPSNLPVIRPEFWDKVQSPTSRPQSQRDRKSTRLNSSH